jgi:hypothetical protein
MSAYTLSVTSPSAVVCSSPHHTGTYTNQHNMDNTQKQDKQNTIENEKQQTNKKDRITNLLLDSILQQKSPSDFLNGLLDRNEELGVRWRGKSTIYM